MSFNKSSQIFFSAAELYGLSGGVVHAELCYIDTTFPRLG